MLSSFENDRRIIDCDELTGCIGLSKMQLIERYGLLFLEGEFDTETEYISYGDGVDRITFCLNKDLICNLIMLNVPNESIERWIVRINYLYTPTKIGKWIDIETNIKIYIDKFREKDTAIYFYEFFYQPPTTKTGQK